MCLRIQKGLLIDWFFFFFKNYINFEWEETLEIVLVQFLHFMDRMILYPISRDVSQIIIHILEIRNFGGENRKKKIRIFFWTFFLFFFFSELSIEKETLREFKNLSLNCSEATSVVYKLCCMLESLITRASPILIKSQFVGWSQVSAVVRDPHVIPVWGSVWELLATWRLWWQEWRKGNHRNCCRKNFWSFIANFCGKE